MRVSTQGNLAQIGWLKHAHPVYISQENLLESVKAVFNDITPHFDVICKWEKKAYKTTEGETKRMKVRVLSLMCPRDIARTVSDIVFDRWLKMGDENSYWYDAASSLRKYMFIPYRKTIQFDANAQVSHLLEHGQWLQKNNEVVYLDRLSSIDVPFEVTQQMIDSLKFDNPSSMLNTKITLRMLFNAWMKKDAHGNTLPSITAIEQIDGKKYALLTHINSVYELYEDVRRVLEVMRHNPHWPTICGTKEGASCTSPKVNPLLLRNAYLDAATTNNTGIQAITSTTPTTTSLFNSNVRNKQRTVYNPYKHTNNRSTIPATSMRSSTTANAPSYANAVTNNSNAFQPPSSTNVTNYVTLSTLQQELQLLCTSFTDMAKSICTEVCTDMINPYVDKIDHTHAQVNTMKNDLLQISELKQELKEQQQSLEKKLDTQFNQILMVLQSTHSTSSPSTKTNQPVSNPSSVPNSKQPPVVTPPKTAPKSSLKHAIQRNDIGDKLTSKKDGNDSDSVDFDYGLSSPSMDEDDLYVGAMDIDITSGTKRQHNDSIQLRRSAPVPPHTPPTPTQYVNYNTSHTIVNSNSTNTTVNGAQGAKGSQKPSAVFINSSALMTAQSSLSPKDGTHKSGSS